VSIGQALNALLFSQRAGRVGSGTIIVRLAGGRERTSIIRADSSAKLNSSPVSKWAVAVVTALYAATLIQVAIRSTVIIAVIIRSTIIDADVGCCVAVLLVSIFTSISSSTSTSSASIATSVTSAVRGSSWAISIDLARSADTGGSVASRLVRDNTSVEGSTLGVASATIASLIFLTIVLASNLGTVVVIIFVGYAFIRIYANTRIRANGVVSKPERSVVGDTLGVRGTCDAITIIVTIEVKCR